MAQINKDEYVTLRDGGKHKWKVKDLKLKKSQVLVDNILVKRAGLIIDLSPEQELEIMKCKLDPIYFLKEYVRINTLDEGIMPFNLFEYQVEMIYAFANKRFTIANLSRQSGKSTCVAGFIVWYMIFHDSKTAAVLANKADQALEIMDRIRDMYQSLPYFLQLGVTKFNFGEVILENGSKAFSGSSNPDTIRGKSINLVYWDEAAHTARDEEFWTSTLPVISSGESTKVIMTSTPKGARGVFFKTWRDSQDKEHPNYNGFHPIEAKWNRHPKRDEAWKATMIAKTSQSQFNQEFEVKFLGSSGTLISTSILELLQWNNPLNSDDHFQIYEYPQENHKYVAIADPSEGVGQDYSVCTVFDTSVIPYKVVAKYRNNEMGPLLFPYQLVSICEKYNTCPLLIESNNDVGGQVAYICYYELEYPEVILTSTDDKGRGMRVGGNKSKPGVKTTSKVKGIGCANLKTMLENGSLILEDQQTIEELGTFIAKGNSYEADEGCHDDCVMTLVLFSWLMKQDWFTEYSETNIQNSLHEGNIDRLRDELLPFYVMDGTDLIQDSIKQYGYVDGISTGISFDQWMKM